MSPGQLRRLLDQRETALRIGDRAALLIIDARLDAEAGKAPPLPKGIPLADMERLIVAARPAVEVMVRRAGHV